jgi:predicted nucleic acid-binding protein
MIYLDSSVALAHLLGEGRTPPAKMWSEDLVSSRLLEYELWTRVNARGLADSHGDAVHRMLAGVSILELSPLVLTRALQPFPVSVRTLDALHLASLEYLQRNRRRVELASYDDRMTAAAKAMGFPLARV